jgi:hypothetical protein
VNGDPVRAIADAVLYEGYILWPYRRSALKNQRRFTFGGVYPPAHSRTHPDDPSSMRTEVLLRAGDETRVEATVRFLQVVHRRVAGPRGEQLEELVVGDERYLPWEEAVEREVRLEPSTVEDLREPRRVPVSIQPGGEREQLPEAAGALMRSWDELQGHVEARAVATGSGMVRVSVEIVNSTPFDGDAREAALERTFCSTHTLLHAQGGFFVSMADPPAELADPASQCRNVGTWPVLVGEAPDASTILSSPIILEDYPRVAPESPGDLFDGGEIDQLLVLNILALTDEEKAEMAASDPRAREVLERTEALTPEQLMALHGTIREFGMAR